MDQQSVVSWQSAACTIPAPCTGDAPRQALFAGTHISNSGVGIIGLDKYDCTLSATGLSLDGISLNHGNGDDWRSSLQCKASVCCRSRGGSNPGS